MNLPIEKVTAVSPRKVAIREPIKPKTRMRAASVSCLSRAPQSRHCVAQLATIVERCHGRRVGCATSAVVLSG